MTTEVSHPAEPKSTSDAHDVGSWLGAIGAPIDVISAQERVLIALEDAGAIRDTLSFIADAAESWHGPPGDAGHEKALAVIAAKARAALEPAVSDG